MTEMSRAVHYDDYGPPGVLKVVDVPKPQPGPGEVLVRVRACALNAYDLMARSGTYKPFDSLPHVLGYIEDARASAR